MLNYANRAETGFAPSPAIQRPITRATVVPLRPTIAPITAIATATATAPNPQPAHPVAPPHWRESLALVDRHMRFTRRRVHAGDAVQLAGEAFTHLHIVNLGAVKTVTLNANGREQIAGLYLKGDWIGFEGIASGRCTSDAYAMDTGEVWSLPFATLQQTVAVVPELLNCLHVAMSCQLARDREWRFALGTLPADARVADFVRSWAKSLAERELRTDQITLRLTRAEIGSYLGMTLETVSRSFSRLARHGLIRFDDKGRRHFKIPSVMALVDFVDGTASPREPCLMQ